MPSKETPDRWKKVMDARQENVKKVVAKKAAVKKATKK